jgi:hypothetical protein
MLLMFIRITSATIYSWFTAYIYLEDVTEKNSPLNFLTGNHVLGKSV